MCVTGLTGLNNGQEHPEASDHTQGLHSEPEASGWGYKACRTGPGALGSSGTGERKVLGDRGFTCGQGKNAHSSTPSSEDPSAFLESLSHSRPLAAHLPGGGTPTHRTRLRPRTPLSPGRADRGPCWFRALGLGHPARDGVQYPLPNTQGLCPHGRTWHLAVAMGLARLLPSLCLPFLPGSENQNKPFCSSRKTQINKSSEALFFSLSPALPPR